MGGSKGSSLEASGRSFFEDALKNGLGLMKSSLTINDLDLGLIHFVS